MRPSIIELLKTFQAMQGPRMIVAHASLFRVAVGHALVSFHHRSDSGFAFRSQAGEVCAGNCDLLGESLKFRLAFMVSSRRSFAFSRQSIRLLQELLEAVFQLPCQLMQA